ncbi:MAG: SIMPL domain-containing protein [Pirellulales bacterium]
MKLRAICQRLSLAGCLAMTAAHVSLGQVINAPGSATSDGITVSGTGEVAARPNLVEIDLQVSGKAELTADAIVKYRDAKKRVLDALAKLDIPNMATSEQAMSVTVGNTSAQQQQFINGQLQNPGKNQVEVSSKVRVKFTGVREMVPEELVKTIGRLLDVAQDAGINVGPSAADMMRAYRYGQQLDNTSPVRFVLDDLAELREKAYEQAVVDARDRATRLAKLHHVNLGSALSIQEIAVGGDRPTTTVVNAYIYQQNAVATTPDADGPRIVSSSLAAVPMQVKLMVRFAITPADPATAQK